MPSRDPDRLSNWGVYVGLPFDKVKPKRFQNALSLSHKPKLASQRLPQGTAKLVALMAALAATLSAQGKVAINLALSRVYPGLQLRL